MDRLKQPVSLSSLKQTISSTVESKGKGLCCKSGSLGMPICKTADFQESSGAGSLCRAFPANVCLNSS